MSPWTRYSEYEVEDMISTNRSSRSRPTFEDDTFDSPFSRSDRRRSRNSSAFGDEIKDIMELETMFDDLSLSSSHSSPRRPTSSRYSEYREEMSGCGHRRSRDSDYVELGVGVSDSRHRGYHRSDRRRDRSARRSSTYNLESTSHLRDRRGETRSSLSINSESLHRPRYESFADFDDVSRSDRSRGRSRGSGLDAYDRDDDVRFLPRGRYRYFERSRSAPYTRDGVRSSSRRDCGGRRDRSRVRRVRFEDEL